MEFGLVYDFRNPAPWQRPWAELYAETLDHVRAVEAMGFDTVWLTEHHFIDDGYLPSVMTMAGALAARTSRVSIGAGSVMLLPLHHPLRVAEDAAVLDILSDGRLRLGFALGYVADEFAAFGVDRRMRASLFEESIAVIRKAWSDGAVLHAGRHWQLPEVAVHPKPVQPGGPPIYVGGRAEKAVRRAARIGDGAIIDADHLRWYQDELRALGREGDGHACVYVLSTPAVDPDHALARHGSNVAYRFRQYTEWYGEAGDLPADRENLAVLRGEQPAGSIADMPPFFETPEHLVNRLLAMRAQGATEAWWFATFPGASPAETLEYWQLMADQVIPRLR